MNSKQNLIEKAKALRAAQRAYLDNRGNSDLGKAVGVAAERLDLAIGLASVNDDTDPTNIHDVMVSAMFMLFTLTMFAGTAYMVQVYGWSFWSFLLTGLFIPTIRTGVNSKEKKDDPLTMDEKQNKLNSTYENALKSLVGFEPFQGLEPNKASEALAEGKRIKDGK